MPVFAKVTLVELGHIGRIEMSDRRERAECELVLMEWGFLKGAHGRDHFKGPDFHFTAHSQSRQWLSAEQNKLPWKETFLLFFHLFSSLFHHYSYSE